MSYRIDGRDIVISGFQDGIADDPYSGISDMRNIENSSIPGEASVAFSTTNSVSQAPLADQTFTASSSSGLLLTWAGGTALADNTAITVANTGGALPVGLAANTAYYVRDSGATTFRLALTAGGTAIAFTDAGTGTQKFTTVNMGKPKFFAPLTTASSSGLTYLYFMLDANGRVWYYYTGTQWIYLRNLNSVGENNGGGTTGNNGNGLVIWKGYLFVFNQTTVDYIKVADGNTVKALSYLTDVSNWVFQWRRTDALLQTTAEIADTVGLFKSGAVEGRKAAQSILPSFGLEFTKIVVPLKKGGTPNVNLTLTIEADSAGDPSGTPLYTSGNVASSGLTTSYAYYTFTFPSTVVLSASTDYWIVLNSSSTPLTNGDSVTWGGSNPDDVYPNGVVKVKDASDVWNDQDGAANLVIVRTEEYPADVSHYAIVGQDNTVYFCNGNAVGSILEASTYQFNPTDDLTYSFNGFALDILTSDVANCLAELGVNLLVGGTTNLIYPWNRVSPSYSYPILLAENNVQRMVTVNTNTYIFAGQRGKIYVTNGSQAQLFKKIPDHLSGVPTPYYTWGDATFNRNQLLFGVKATNNAGVAINQYGGLWAIDLVTEGIRLLNQLSYGSYAGIASAVFALLGSPTSDGYGLLIGWDSGSSTYSVDKGSPNPYSNDQSYVDADMIPVGTLLNSFSPAQIEWKTSAPLVANESVKLYYRKNISDSFTLIPTNETTLVGKISNVVPANFQKAQWVQIRAVTSSTASSPSFARLTELRIRNYPK